MYTWTPQYEWGSCSPNIVESVSVIWQLAVPCRESLPCAFVILSCIKLVAQIDTHKFEYNANPDDFRGFADAWEYGGGVSGLWLCYSVLLLHRVLAQKIHRHRVYCWPVLLRDADTCTAPQDLA